MKRTLGLLTLTGIVLLFALVTGFILFTRLLYVLILTLAASYLWSWLNLRWLEVQVDRRTLRVHVGQQLDERITVRNKGWLPKAWLEVVELTDIQEHYPGRTVSLAAKGFRSWRASTRPRRRGHYHLGPVRIATGDPFGLFRLERHYTDSQRVLVLPAVVPLSRFSTPPAGLPSDGLMRQRSHQVTPHAASVREYLPCDSVSRIHWPTSARLGSLMVKEFDLGLTSDLWIILDLEATVQAQDEDDSTDELAVTAAASIARYFLTARLPVGLAVNAGELALLPPDRGHLQDARILELLAQVKAEGATPLADAITNLDPSLSRYTTLVVITPSPSDQWVLALGTLAHRNVRLAAVLVDGATFGGEKSPREIIPALVELGILTYLVGKGDNLTKALGHPFVGQWDGFASASGNRNFLFKGASP
ncbi:DUF58 domain-containing protein [Chloroflexota bacterium]